MVAMLGVCRLWVFRCPYILGLGPLIPIMILLATGKSEMGL